MLQHFVLLFTGAPPSQNSVVLDTKILRLHSRISFNVFLISSILLTIKEIFNGSGENISCFGRNPGTSKDEDLNAYCWSHSTYSVTKYFHSCSAYKDCIYPGVGQLLPSYETVFHRYYQWTSIALFFQAVISYAPRFIWKNFCEDGLQRILSLEGKLHFYPLSHELVSEEDVARHKSHLTSYFITHMRQHQKYFFEYCFFELLGLLTAILNVVVIDLMLNFKFLSYGPETIRYWLGHHHKLDVSPMVKIFPLMTKCDFRIHGPSGNIIPKDPVCLLPLNSLNDKVYLFLWFYLIFVLIISSISLLYRSLTTFIFKFRYILLKQKSQKVKVKVVQDLCERLYIGEWFVIYLLSNNVSPQFFQEFLESLWEELHERKLSV